MGQWVNTVDASGLQEGKAVKFKAGEIPVVIAKIAGQVHAMLNQCPHMGCFLHRGNLSGYLLTCPCHDWIFDFRTGEFTAAPEIKIPVFPTKIEDGILMIDIGGMKK